ncbi:hypothetical protein CTAYLR_003771 [Chrysophaeum taylorii]|uniref:Uncharacterized protein n=1 Tax=Chrysophaeum taylorii TaxID=2483200 RepID=A0AAD7UF11_9STRA|nr:hypothetical protein CTAYLR_003771 [Chrysophaeum taylorii]
MVVLVGAVAADPHVAMRSALAKVARCQFRVRAWAPSLEIVFANRTSKYFAPHNASALRQRVVCRRGSGKKSTSLLMVANDLKYLFRFWPYFLQKVMWADESKNVASSVWIGELPEEFATTVGDECRDSPELAEGWMHHTGPYRSYYERSRGAVNSNHHIKTLAAYAMLDYGGVFYADLDYVVVDWGWRAAATVAKLENSVVEVLFNSASPMWHVKGRTFYVKGWLGREFMATWLFYRCGFKDQYSLWHTILELADRFGCLKYDGEIMNHTYKEFKHLQDVLYHDVSCENRKIRCPDFHFCDDDLRVGAGFDHRMVAATANRTLEYYDGGIRYGLVVPDPFGGGGGGGGGNDDDDADADFFLAKFFHNFYDN